MVEPVRVYGTFARATREALESVVSPAVAATLLARAVSAMGRESVPEDAMPFRDFVEGPLRTELSRLLGPAAVALVVERLGNVLWMATSDVRLLGVARDWSRRGNTAGKSAHESGSRPKLDASGRPTSDRPVIDPVSAKRPTIPVPPSSPPGSSPPTERGSAPPALAGAAFPRPPRLPTNERPDVPSGVALRTARTAATLTAMPRVPGVALPSSVLVVTLDPALSAHTVEEVAGRCPVITISAPNELARAATRAGDRVVVIVDTTLPSIELPTFVGLSPILPPNTRVLLWGADERQGARLASRFPVARSWVTSGDSLTPGTLALSLAR